ncbi:MAG: NAD(P)H-dependent glycerol-3-phosphate dehydrogenase [Myxococcota bacterium]
MNIGIIGSGAWGKALATLIAKAGHEPRIGFRGTRPSGFPGTPNLRTLTEESELLIIAVPAEGVATAIEQAKPGAGHQVVLATRGLQPETGDWLSDLVLKHTACRRVGSLAGPAMASEVVRGRPTALVIASPFDGVCSTTQAALHSEHCRVYTTHDLQGVELAGAMVSVLAVAVGIADGVNLGVGAKGVIVTRGIAEASRLGKALGADPQTFSGLAGVGDLVSCASHPDHPSFSTGVRISQGGSAASRTIDEARAVLSLANRHGIDLPLTKAALAIMTGQLRPKLAFNDLMRRQARAEST